VAIAEWHPLGTTGHRDDEDRIVPLADMRRGTRDSIIAIVMVVVALALARFVVVFERW
jgi:hypothetical protein